ncbi:hypothetical protein BHE74_00048746 [Ensete ventricosum]|nr:hypothetical protein BHE74_00048746 [Ensete ventricosum]RZR90324.1 hypothetical protein BHM03_00018183 [Ensete ventricosum]
MLQTGNAKAPPPTGFRKYMSMEAGKMRSATLRLRAQLDGEPHWDLSSHVTPWVTRVAGETVKEGDARIRKKHRRKAPGTLPRQGKGSRGERERGAQLQPDDTWPRRDAYGVTSTRPSAYAGGVARVRRSQNHQNHDRDQPSFPMQDSRIAARFLGWGPLDRAANMTNQRLQQS